MERTRMPDPEPAGPSEPGRLRIPLLQETLTAAVEAAGPVWPTPALALGSLFERGVLFLEAGGTLPPLAAKRSTPELARLDEVRGDLLLIDALAPLTRYATFKLIRDSEEMEATWIALADRHLAIRSEIVESRREEERLKREIVSLGGASVALPEHDDLPESSGDRPRKSRGMYGKMFAGTEIVEATIDVAPPLASLADTIAEAKGWTDEWGQDARLLVLTYGLSLDLREREAEAIDLNDDASVRAALDEARSRLMGLEGRYSTVRRRLFELRHNARILQWRITALQIEARGMQNRLEQFRADRERLEREIAERRAS